MPDGAVSHFDSSGRLELGYCQLSECGNRSAV